MLEHKLGDQTTPRWLEHLQAHRWVTPLLPQNFSQGNACEQAKAALLADAQCSNSDTRWWVTHEIYTGYWSPKCYLHHIGFSVKSFSGKGEYVLYMHALFMHILFCHCGETWWVQIQENKANITSECFCIWVNIPW